MKLNLDFALYKGTTRLKQWWKEVKAHFTQVQEAHNALEDTVAAESTKLSAEITQRTNADTTLSNRITSEEKARAAADATLQQNINSETSARQTADTTLQNNINAEISARKATDTALDGRVKAVEDKAHTHGNKTVLDGITEERVTTWDSIKEQVTQTQLDEAIAAEAAARASADTEEITARTEADNVIIAMFNAAKAYLEDMCFSFSDEFQRIYTAIGITVYDGGLFGMEQTDIALDGGDFADEILGGIDCGGFEPITVNISGGTAAGGVIDGGTFASISTSIIDGGRY